MSLKANSNFWLGISRWTCSNCHRSTRLTRQVHTTVEQPRASGNPFPFPVHRNPTPHQIFHLPHNATPKDIKARYYDLVRIYHPDKLGSSADADAAHARFQSISSAYDSLRGKAPLPGAVGSTATAAATPPFQKSAAYANLRKRQQDLYSSGAADESWKDKLILAGVILTVVIVMAQTAMTRRDVLKEAISKSRLVVDDERRQKQRAEEALLSLDASAAPPPAADKS